MNDDEMYNFVSALRNLDGFGAEEIEDYLNTHWHRFMVTLDLIKSLNIPGGKLLEIGSSPYLLTSILEKATPYEISTCNYYGPQNADTSHHQYKSSQTGEVLSWESLHFDAEADEYPYADDSFDIVLASEILEHFTTHPAWLLMESNRVLKPGGYLVLTTPNATRSDALLRMMKGENNYDSYSGYGPGGRHNREYTMRELTQWTEKSGFKVVKTRIQDVYPHNRLETIISHLFSNRRDNLFLVIQKIGEFHMYRPDYLYRGEPFLTKLQSSDVLIGEENCSQLGEGWWPAEQLLDMTGRWTSSHARIYLRNRGNIKFIKLTFYGGKGDGETQFDICNWEKISINHKPNEWQTINLKLNTDFKNPNFYIDIIAPVFSADDDQRSLGHYFHSITADQ